MRNKSTSLLLTLLVVFSGSLLLGGHPARAQSPSETPAPTIIILTATRQEDGSVMHEVQPGQAVWSIANAYGLSIDQLNQLNNLPTDAVLYAGDRLIIAPSYTPTPSPTITNTPLPPTRTPLPTRTLRPDTLTPTLAPTRTATPRPLIPAVPALQGDTRRGLGIGLIVLCAAGILAVLVHGVKNK